MEKLPLSPPGYCLYRGGTGDKDRLVDFLQRTYHSLFPEQKEFAHLNQTVESYFSWRSPLWWVIPEVGNQDLSNYEHQSRQTNQTQWSMGFSVPEPGGETMANCQPVAGIWVGNAVDQVSGQRHGHIFMLYVEPDHRRRGIATALVQQAQQWGAERGDRRLGLQVFSHNQGAIALYQKLGFAPRALLLHKTW